MIDYITQAFTTEHCAMTAMQQVTVFLVLLPVGLVLAFGIIAATAFFLGKK